MRLSGIRHVDPVTTTKCYKGPRRGNMKAQKGIVLHASVVDYVLHSLVRCIVFSVVKQLVRMVYMSDNISGGPACAQEC